MLPVARKCFTVWTTARVCDKFTIALFKLASPVPCFRPRSRRAHGAARQHEPGLVAVREHGVRRREVRLRLLRLAARRVPETSESTESESVRHFLTLSRDI